MLDKLLGAFYCTQKKRRQEAVAFLHYLKCYFVTSDVILLQPLFFVTYRVVL